MRQKSEAATGGVPEEKVLQACNVIKKETLEQVFSCEFFEISENTFFTEHLKISQYSQENTCIGVSF